jgi:signal transduction histidine kinase
MGKIFKPFYSTKEPGSGTGLGLSIGDTIIEKHGGRIEVKANRDNGTTFTIILPLYDPAVEEKTEGMVH